MAKQLKAAAASGMYVCMYVCMYSCLHVIKLALLFRGSISNPPLYVCIYMYVYVHPTAKVQLI